MSEALPNVLRSRVEVLILNWNGWRDTIECLRSLYASDYANFGVVVCDNASTNDSFARIRDWAEEAEVGGRKLVFRESANEEDDELNDAVGRVDLLLIQTGANLGFAGGNNVAIRRLIGCPDVDYIWLLNNDTIIAPETLSRLVARLDADTTLGAVGGVMLEYSQPTVIQEAGATYSPWHGMVRSRGTGERADAPRREPERIDYITGGCMLIRTSVIRRIGLLDERFFMYSEDVDWGIRVRKAGFRLALEMQADVWHKGGGSAEYGSALHDYFSVKSALLLVQKQHAWRLPVAFLYSIYRCLLPKVVRGQWHRFVAVIRAYRDFVRSWSSASSPPSGSERRSRRADVPAKA